MVFWQHGKKSNLKLLFKTQLLKVLVQNPAANISLIVVIIIKFKSSRDFKLRVSGKSVLSGKKRFKNVFLLRILVFKQKPNRDKILRRLHHLFHGWSAHNTPQTIKMDKKKFQKISYTDLAVLPAQRGKK
jgi:hypothetical protein